MKPEEIAKEIQKCKDNPYYFATKYLTIKNNDGNSKPFATIMSEKDFNSLFKRFNFFKK